MRWDFPLTTMVVFAALAALSVLTLTVVIFKLMQFRRMGVGHHKLGETILDDWLNGRPDEAQFFLFMPHHHILHWIEGNKLFRKYRNPE